MPKGEQIRHGNLFLNFKTNDNGEVMFKIENDTTSIKTTDGYLSTEEFHALRGLVSHGYNHLNKHYGNPSRINAPWTSNCIREGSIIKCITPKYEDQDLTDGKLYVVSAVESGVIWVTDDVGVRNSCLSKAGDHYLVIQR